jgi:3-methyladenine DNA glycosylase Mpg
MKVVRRLKYERDKNLNLNYSMYLDVFRIDETLTCKRVVISQDNKILWRFYSKGKNSIIYIIYSQV